MAADIREPSSSGPAAPAQAQALHRGLIVRIGVALAVLAAVAVVAVVGLNHADTDLSARAPAAAKTAPVVVAQPPLPLAEPAPAAASPPAVETGEPGSIEPQRDSPSASATASASVAEALAPAPEQPPDAIGQTAPGGETAPSAMAKLQPDAAAAQKSESAAASAKADAVQLQPHAAQAEQGAAPGKPARGPRLQAGVFMQSSNAQAFKARLEAQGFPAYIETRVHVGPFKDRKEAEAAREKLQEMGVTTVLIGQ